MMISKAKLFRVEKKGYLEISDSGVLGLLLFENSNYLSLLVRVDIFLRKSKGSIFGLKRKAREEKGKVDDERTNSRNS